MKKFKILSAALVAAMLGITGCNKNKNPVKSIDLDVETKSVYDVSEPFQLTASVDTSDEASKDVTWSSSDTAVATVSETGLVTPVAPGTVTITVTSVTNPGKTDSVTVTVLSSGAHSDAIAGGFDYSATFPYAEAKAFIGADVVGIEASEGFYYQVMPVTQTRKISFFLVLMEYTQANSAALLDVLDEGEFKLYGDASGSACYLDPTLTYEIDPYLYGLGETNLLAAAFYKASDLFEPATTTTDSSWNSVVTADVTKYTSVAIPFIKLGEEYATWYDSEEDILYILDGCVDYNKLDGYGTLLYQNGFTKYSDPTYGDYYVKSEDEYTDLVVMFFFDYAGNNIAMYHSPKQLEEFPGDAVSSFVATFSKYSVPAPTIAGEDAYYTFIHSVEEDEESVMEYVTVGVYGATKTELQTYVGGLVAGGWELDEENSYEHYYGADYALLTKGKIGLVATIEYGSHDANDTEIAAMLARAEELGQLTQEQYNALSAEEKAEYSEVMMNATIYAFTGTFTVYDYDVVVAASISLYENADGIEDPGLYIRPQSGVVYIDKTYQLDPFFYELAESDILYSSSDDTVATVDEHGLITGVANGEAVITASATVDAVEYKAEFEVTVTAAPELNVLGPEFFADGGIDDVPVAPYVSSNDLSYEIDDSFADWGYLDVYVYGGTRSDMDAYATALVAAGWTIVSGEPGKDYMLTYGETGACIELLDYIESHDCVDVSFYID